MFKPYSIILNGSILSSLVLSAALNFLIKAIETHNTPYWLGFAIIYGIAYISIQIPIYLEIKKSIVYARTKGKQDAIAYFKKYTGETED